MMRIRDGIRRWLERANPDRPPADESPESSSELRRFLASIGPGDVDERASWVLQRVGQLARAYPEYPGGDAAGRDDLAGALDAIARCESVHGASDQALVVQALVLGKLGRFKEAIARTRAAYERAPTWSATTSYANALRRSGELEGCLKLMGEASELDVSDVTALLDIGDARLEQGRWAEALAAYEKALSREPEHPWAEPSACYCRYRAHGDDRALTALREIASRSPDECGVDAALAYIQGTYARDEARERAAFLLSRI